VVTHRSVWKTQAGVTLIELLVMSVIASLVALTVIQGFSGISRGIIATRFKSLATQLAHEKLQSLKSTSYYRLRVSSHTVVPQRTERPCPFRVERSLQLPPHRFGD
jgi:type II secretory pathway pseudopilin PulG